MPSDDPILTPPPVSRHPVDVGLRTEAAITHALAAMGHHVFIPIGQSQRYDLLVEVDGEFHRCLCKTCRIRGGSIQFSARSVRSNTKSVLTRDSDSVGSRLPSASAHRRAQSGLDSAARRSSSIGRAGHL